MIFYEAHMPLLSHDNSTKGKKKQIAFSSPSSILKIIWDFSMWGIWSAWKRLSKPINQTFSLQNYLFLVFKNDRELCSNNDSNEMINFLYLLSNMKADKGTNFSWFWVLYTDSLLTWKCTCECFLVPSLLTSTLTCGSRNIDLFRE